MGTPNQFWANGPVGFFAVLLIVLLIWALAENKHFFRSTGGDLKSSVQDVGHDIKSTGRDVGDSIRRTVNN